MSSRPHQNELPAHAATAPSRAATTKGGKPRALTNLGAMKQFFTDNPHEELSIDDAATKFDVARKTAQYNLSVLAGKGLIERVSIYRRKTD